MPIRILFFRGALFVLLGTLMMPAFAQDDSADEKKGDQKEQVQDEVKIDSLKELQADFSKRNREFMTAVRGAGRDADKRKSAMELMPNVSEYIESVSEFANEDVNPKDLARALSVVARQVRAPRDRKRVSAMVLEHLIESEEMIKMLPMFRGNAKALRMVFEKNEHEEVKGNALYALIGTLNSKMEDDDDEAAKEVDELMETLMSDYADAEDSRGVTFVARLAGQKFASEKLQIGLPVPEISGMDVDGVEFKLSDYKGKVTVIDFWGDW